ncbi:hypothetical protein [Enterococcus devriesei]|uniref:hypothetical protein n=1 Tax=Enterococcus devriesei TaxID=319970 RepID=UPI0036D21908
MNVSEISNFREYVEEQQHICYGVELGGTPAVVGSLSRQYDFLLETIDTYQEINQPQLNDNQQIVLEWLKEAYKRTKWSSPFGTVYSTINIHELFVQTRLTKAQQFQVLAAFAEWGLSHAEE